MAAIKVTKIILYDSEKDIAVEALVSEADAERARTDIYFAIELLRSAINKDRHVASTSTNNVDDYDEHAQENFMTEDEVPVASKITDDVHSETQESEDGVSSCRWTPPAVLLLLESYRSMEGIRNRGKISQKQMWIKIAEKLNESGYIVTGPQCDSKLRSLKKTYKAIKDHNNKSGNNRKTWPYFEVIDEMFSQNAWCDPVAVASSTGLSMKKTASKDSAVESDSRCSSKSNKTPIATLLRKRLQQKEEHKENKKKRHQERMEMDAKFLKVLEKLAEK